MIRITLEKIPVEKKYILIFMIMLMLLEIILMKLKCVNCNVY